MTSCGWLQSRVKISVFLLIWGISEEILKESAENRKSLYEEFPVPKIWTWYLGSRYVSYSSCSLSLYGLPKRPDCPYRPIFFVNWHLVIFLCKVRSSADSFSISLIIPQIGQNTLILTQLWSQPQLVIRGLFRRFGYRLTSIFSEKSREIKIMYFRDTYILYF